MRFFCTKKYIFCSAENSMVMFAIPAWITMSYYEYNAAKEAKL